MQKQSAIEMYISQVACQMGIELAYVALVGGMSLGCTDIDLVNISSHGREVGAVIFQADLDLLADGVVCERLEFGIRIALSRLQKVLLTSGTVL